MQRSRVHFAQAARRRAERALGESERRYRDLVEQSLGLICAHDLDGTVLLVNPAAARLLGYAPEEGIGRDLRLFLAPEMRPLFDDYLVRIRQRGSDEGLMRLVSRDGSERIWLYRNVLRRDPGRPAYVLGHALDVTDRIGTEKALRESQRALEAAYRDLDLRVRERTAALEEANSRLRDEMLERRRAEEARERVLLDQRNIQSFLAGVSDRLGALSHFDDACRDAARMPVPFLADWSLLHLLDEDGTLRSVAGAHVSPDREVSLQALAKLTSGRLPPASVVARVLAMRRLEMLRVAQVGEGEAFLGPGPAASLLPELGCNRVVVVPLVVGDRILGVLSLVGTAEGRFSDGDLSIVKDFARRVCLTIERIQLYEEAQEANRLKEDFLTTLSHELRTPLNAILGWARILQLRGVGPTASKAINVIARNAEAQARLIDEILDVSRIVTGKLRLSVDVLDVGATVRAALDVVRPSAEAKGVRLDERLGSPLPPVAGDPHRLQQVVWNLLSNAVKFTEEGGLVSVTVWSGAGGIAIAVEDSGVGIRPDVLPFVFDRFRQADSSTTRAHGGLGLGLAIARHLVHLHGGTIEARSEGEGRGSTFVVHLPAATGVRFSDFRLAGDRAQEGGVAAARLRGRTILVVDDNDDARELLTDMLENAGAAVIAAASAREGVAAFERARPDLVLADIALPGEDGYALLGRLRDLQPVGRKVPAIAVTAYARAEDRDRALAAGFARHIVKPVDPQVLIDTAAAMVNEPDPLPRKPPAVPGAGTL